LNYYIFQYNNSIDDKNIKVKLLNQILIVILITPAAPELLAPLLRILHEVVLLEGLRHGHPSGTRERIATCNAIGYYLVAYLETNAATVGRRVVPRAEHVELLFATHASNRHPAAQRLGTTALSNSLFNCELYQPGEHIRLNF